MHTVGSSEAARLFSLGDVFGLVTALCALVTVVIAWKALSIWKKESKARISHVVASDCIRGAYLILEAVLRDRFKLSRISDEHTWGQYGLASSHAKNEYRPILFEASTYFGDGIGSLLLELTAHVTRLEELKYVYQFHLQGEQVPLPHRTYLQQAIEVFGSTDPSGDSDSFNLKVEASVHKIQEQLQGYLIK